MDIRLLTDDIMAEFVQYCRLHRFEHDESYLSAEDLAEFTEHTDVSVAIVDGKKIIGVFSVMHQEHFRTRIFHAADGKFESYKALHGKMCELLGERRKPLKFDLFIPEKKQQVISHLLELGYHTERFVFLLEREDAPGRPARFPDLCTLSPMVFPDDVADWTRIRNQAFRPLQGFIEYPTERFARMAEEPEYLPDATLVLRMNGEAVGIIKAERDEQPDGTEAFIGPIAVSPEFQGRGLGRNMLRELLNRMHETYALKCTLCVNAENDDALRLYGRFSPHGP